MANLDSINFKKQDPEGMIDFIENFPKMCRDAWALSKKFALPSYYIKAKKFLLLGMGGSGAAGDIIVDLLENQQNIIIKSCHTYDIPDWVDSETIVIACSYSGSTEETLAAFAEAKKRDAKLIAITTGGKLKQLAEKYGIPLFLFNLEAQPRAAFPYHFAFLLSIFVKLGHYELNDGDFESSIDYVEQNLLKVKSSNRIASNPAKLLALKLENKIPVFYSSGILRSVGQRLKTQVNENAKTFSFCEVLPELNHNSIVALFHPKNCDIVIIMLESSYDNLRVTQHQNITASILRKYKIVHERIKFVPAGGEIAEILTMVMFGDFVSYYLAVLENSDISEVSIIHELKAQLNNSKQ